MKGEIDLKIKKLKQGEKFKNYKQLCEELGLPVKTGKSKILQMEKLEELYQFKREGQAYVVECVTQQVVPRKEKRGGSHNKKYANEIEIIMLYILNNSNEGDFECSASSAMEACSLVNRNYLDGRYNVGETSEVMAIEKEYIYDFYARTHSRLKKTFERALKSMKDKSLILYDEIIKIKVTNERGSWYYREATRQERKSIMAVERAYMLKHGCENKQELFARGRWHEFDREVREELKELEIEDYFNAYRILKNDKGVEREVEFLECEQSRYTLSETVSAELLKSAEKRKKKEQLAFGENTNVATKELFLPNQQKMTEVFIQHNPELNLKRELITAKINKKKEKEK